MYMFQRAQVKQHRERTHGCDMEREHMPRKKGDYRYSSTTESAAIKLGITHNIARTSQHIKRSSPCAISAGDVR